MEHGFCFLPGNTAEPPLRPQSLKYSNWPFVGRVSHHLPQKVKDRGTQKQGADLVVGGPSSYYNPQAVVKPISSKPQLMEIRAQSSLPLHSFEVQLGLCTPEQS